MHTSYADYGMEKSEIESLLKGCKAGKYAAEVRIAAYETNPLIAESIISSVINGKSYWRLEKESIRTGQGLIPCGHSDFYGARRHTIAILAKMLDGRRHDGRL